MAGKGIDAKRIDKDKGEHLPHLRKDGQPAHHSRLPRQRRLASRLGERMAEGSAMSDDPEVRAGTTPAKQPVG